jgi:hypothetical protein
MEVGLAANIQFVALLKIICAFLARQEKKAQSLHSSSSQWFCCIACKKLCLEVTYNHIFP